MLKIRFNGQEYLFTGDSLDKGGPIATEDEYIQGEVNFAHLFPDGIIMRYHETIGTRDDIEILDTDVDIKMSDEGIENTLGWFS